jgi:ABC-type amino acid transport substrate-binding protein
MFTYDIEVMLQTGKTPSLCALLPGQRLTHQEKGILMPKDPPLVTFVNQWLTEEIAAGRIEALKRQHLGSGA